ncbi:hypothetical protein Tco_1089407, partial [Tanacetum coccineum]
KIDDPNITMEEYIRLEEEKVRRHGRTFNWQTSTFGKDKNYENKDDHPIDFETEFPAIVFDYTLTAIRSEPMVRPPNENELDFRISLDESDDEDYTDNDIDEIDIEKSSRDMSVVPLPNINDGAYALRSNKLLETSHDTSNKIFKTETFIKELCVNINTKGQRLQVSNKAFWREPFDGISQGDNIRMTEIIIKPPKSIQPPGRPRKRRLSSKDRGCVKRNVHCRLVAVVIKLVISELLVMRLYE